jgi:hypothetical protein
MNSESFQLFSVKLTSYSPIIKTIQLNLCSKMIFIFTGYLFYNYSANYTMHICYILMQKEEVGFMLIILLTTFTLRISLLLPLSFIRGTRLKITS